MSRNIQERISGVEKTHLAAIDDAFELHPRWQFWFSETISEDWNHTARITVRFPAEVFVL